MDTVNGTVENIRRCTQNAVVLATLRLSDLSGCCGTMEGLIAGGNTFTYVGLMTRNKYMLLNTRFMQGLRGLFPPIECRTDICALDMLVGDLGEISPVVRLYSHELDVPIYFSTTRTELIMDGRMERGDYISCRTHPRNLAAIYLVDTNAKQYTLLFQSTGPSPVAPLTRLSDGIYRFLLSRRFTKSGGRFLGGWFCPATD